MKKQVLLSILSLMPLMAIADAVEIDGLYYNLYDTNQAEVTYNPSVPTDQGCYSGDIIIPASVSYNGIKYDVTSIGNYTFQYSEGMTSITIPESVTSIGKRAFDSCDGLTSITLPNSVTSIGEEAFIWCMFLKSINIPDNVTKIEKSTFQSCMNITSIVIPNGVTSIGDHAFDACLKLTSINIPSGVTYIGRFAFYNCNFTSITIPDNVTNIQRYTFHGCIFLKSVTIGRGVKEIGKNCFGDCIGLTDVYCLADDVPVTEDVVFDDDLSGVTLHVPEGSIDNYRNTAPWSTFGSIVALTAEETSIESIDDDDSSDILRFTLDGRRIHNPQKGLNIIKTRNGQTRKILVR